MFVSCWDNEQLLPVNRYRLYAQVRNQHMSLSNYYSNPAQPSAKVACKYSWGISAPERSTDNCQLLKDTSKLSQQIERKVEGPWLYIKYIFFSIIDLVHVSVSCEMIGEEEKFLVRISLTQDRAIYLILCRWNPRLGLFVVCDLDTAVRQLSHSSLSPHALQR